MKTRTFFTVWICTALLLAFASNAAEKSADIDDDQIVASFERELNHETPQPRLAAGRDIDDDVLYERVAKPLQSPETGETTDKGDQS